MIYPTMLDTSTLTAIYTAAMRYAEKVVSPDNIDRVAKEIGSDAAAIRCGSRSAKTYKAVLDSVASNARLLTTYGKDDLKKESVSVIAGIFRNLTVERQSEYVNIWFNIDVTMSFEEILVRAVGYAVGQQNYLPCLIKRILFAHIGQMGTDSLYDIVRIINDRSRRNELGDPETDAKVWLEIREHIVKELRERMENGDERMPRLGSIARVYSTNRIGFDYSITNYCVADDGRILVDIQQDNRDDRVISAVWGEGLHIDDDDDIVYCPNEAADDAVML